MNRWVRAGMALLIMVVALAVAGGCGGTATSTEKPPGRR